MWPGARSPFILASCSSGVAVRHTAHDLLLLDHFVNNIGTSIAGPEYERTFTVDVLDIAKEVPFLMHSMIALAACHLQHTMIDGRMYRMPEALHTQLASQGLRQAIGLLKDVRDMDSVLTSSMLLNCLSFCYADWKDDEEEMERRRPSWQWLRIQMGIKDLLIQTRPFHAESIWMPMFTATNTFAITETPHNDLDSRLARFCGITSSSTSETCPYFDFYTQLAPLVTRMPSVYYLRLYTNAVGGINYGFIEMLEKEDSKAMMLFAHWLALMCSCVSWWITRRTSRECWMICWIFDERVKGDNRMLLERPVQACGYVLEA